jgi:hypothetical protein
MTSSYFLDVSLLVKSSIGLGTERPRNDDNNSPSPNIHRGER